MSADFRSTGAFNVNDQFATRVRYEATVQQAQVVDVQVRFANGRTEIARARLTAEQARELLGARNFGAIEKAAARAMPAGSDRPAEPVKGELRGRSLEFRQVVLPGYQVASTENAIMQDSRTRAAQPAAQPPRDDPRPVGDPAARPGGDRLDSAPAAGSDEQDRLRRQRAAAVPPAVAERFLRIEDRYYFADRTLAFIDQGIRLKAESHNAEVVRSLVAIAEARNWQALRVTGTQDFRRQVWREASLRGIDVRGYEPGELEREELRRAIEKRHGPSEVSRDAAHRPPAEAGRNAATAPSRAQSQDVPDQHKGSAQPAPHDARDGIRAGVAIGVLLEHGAAPYRFDQDNDASYYVRLRTDRGEQTLWGVDLKRAVAESRTSVQAGDVVGVENLGNRPVTLTVRKRDASGQVVTEEIDTHRNAWSVEQKAYFQQQAAKAAAVRHSDRASRIELVAKHPDLADAVVNLWLGEQVAKKRIEQPQDRQRFVAAVRERLAQAIERGEPVRAPTMRRQVAALLDADRAGGQASPRSAAPAPAGRAATDQTASSPPDRTTQAPRARTPKAPQHAR